MHLSASSGIHRRRLYTTSALPGWLHRIRYYLGFHHATTVPASHLVLHRPSYDHRDHRPCSYTNATTVKLPPRYYLGGSHRPYINQSTMPARGLPLPPTIQPSNKGARPVHSYLAAAITHQLLSTDCRALLPLLTQSWLNACSACMYALFL